MRDKLKKFNVEMVTDLGGCKPAMKYLRSMYGDEVADLSNKKEEVLKLIDSGKEDWVISFCLNVIGIEERKFFLEHILLDLSAFFISDAALKRAVRKILNALNKVEQPDLILVDCIDVFRDRLEIYSKEDLSEVNQNTVEIFKAEVIIKTIEQMEVDLIKCCLTATKKTCDSIITKESIKGNSSNINKLRRAKMKEYALIAMNITGIWNND